MASGNGGPAPQQLETLFDAGTAVGLSDRRLLERFLSGAGAGAEAAFAALVERHGPMVLRVCRDTLRDPHDADDAFQAAFLVLARRAGSIREGDSVGPWLHGVALRVAACARSAAARRRLHERRGAAMSPESAPIEDRTLAELAPLLHAEIGRLPERNRTAVVLCYFQGLTHDEAAAQLGWPVGTIKSRLAWAREKLRSRLIRRGIMPSAALLTSTAAATKAATAPPALARATIQLALHAAEAGAVPAAIALLTERTLRIFLMTNLKWAATGFVAAGLVASGGVGLVAARQQPDDRPAAKPATSAIPQDVARTPATTSTSTTDRPIGRSVPGLSAAEPPTVLLSRLKVAERVLDVTDRMFKTGEVTSVESTRARGEFEALANQLLGRADELRDELEVLEAELEVKRANIEVSKAEAVRATDNATQAESLASRAAISKKNLDDAQSALSIGHANVFVRVAEANVVAIRVRQLKRRNGEIGPMVAEAKALMEYANRAFGTAPAPPTAAPPAGVPKS